MSKLEKVAPTGACHRLHVSAADFRKIKKIDHLRMFFLLQLIREFEDTLLELKDANLVHGPVHSSIGQEANAAAAAVVLKKSDLVGSTHRAHGHFLAKAVMYYAPEDFNPELNDFTADMQRAVNKTLAEIMGLKSGWCAGRGGSMHLSDPASGNIGSNGIVGGGIPLATGAAWAEKLSAGSRVVVSFFGDGAINQGCFHEVANMASLWDLPIVYFVENNLYAVATATCTSSSCINLGLRSLGYGIDSLIVDGMDPVAVFCALDRVVTEIQVAPRPFLIESETYRFYHHAGRLPGSPFGYRSQTEEIRWQDKDPLQVYAGKLVEKKIISGGQQADMLARAKAAVSEAVGFCTAETDGKLFIPDSHWPPPQDLVRDVRCEDDAFDDVRFVEKADFDQFSEMSYVEAISAATLRNMQKDEKVFVLGEEVANLHGGAYRATRGIKEVFPEGLDVEVVDLRTLDYSGLDFDTIGQSVEKTGLVLILEQVPRSMGIASRISDEIQERFYDFLEAPVEKIPAPDVPALVSRALETAMLPNIELIKQRLRAVGKA